MNNQPFNTPQDLVDSLKCGAKIIPTGPFWDAYHHLDQDDAFGAIECLDRGYFEEGYFHSNCSRIDYIQCIAHHGHYPLPSVDWLTLLANANAQSSLYQLFSAGRIEAIHAVHGLIESGHEFHLEPLYPISDSEETTLLELYDLEAELIGECIETSDLTRAWLRARNQRAWIILQNARELRTAS